MRETVIYSLDDGKRFSLGTSVEPICAIMEIGYAEDAITFYVNMKGDEVINFIKKYAPDKGVQEQINPNGNYKIVGYDW